MKIKKLYEKQDYVIIERTPSNKLRIHEIYYLEGVWHRTTSVPFDFDDIHGFFDTHPEIDDLGEFMIDLPIIVEETYDFKNLINEFKGKIFKKFNSENDFINCIKICKMDEFYHLCREHDGFIYILK